MTSKRKAKKDTRWATRRKLPAYAREMLRAVDKHADRVYVYEWKELFDSFDRKHRVASKVIFWRLRRTWRFRDIRARKHNYP